MYTPKHGSCADPTNSSDFAEVAQPVLVREFLSCWKMLQSDTPPTHLPLNSEFPRIYAYYLFWMPPIKYSSITWLGEVLCFISNETDHRTENYLAYTTRAREEYLGLEFEGPSLRWQEYKMRKAIIIQVWSFEGMQN